MRVHRAPAELTRIAQVLGLVPPAQQVRLIPILVVPALPLVPRVLLVNFQQFQPLRVPIVLRAPTKPRLVKPRVLNALLVPPTRGSRVTPLPQSVSLALLVRFRLKVPPRVPVALRAPTKTRLVPPRVPIALRAPTKTRLVHPSVLIALPVPPTRGFKLTLLPQSVSLALLVNFQLPVPPRVLIAPLVPFSP